MIFPTSFDFSSFFQFFHKLFSVYFLLNFLECEHFGIFSALLKTVFLFLDIFFFLSFAFFILSQFFNVFVFFFFSFSLHFSFLTLRHLTQQSICRDSTRHTVHFLGLGTHERCTRAQCSDAARRAELFCLLHWRRR